MDVDSQRVLQHLAEVEEAAEDVLADRQQIVDLDKKRNRNREALNSLRGGSFRKDKVMVCFGNMFIKFPKEDTKRMIEKDQEQLDKEVDDLRKRLKAKVNHLYDLEGKPELKGYNLSPLTSEEMKSINSILRR
ncbi:p53 and DNA damage-regulated protein 1 [Denticeps clupeoides]|nr:p53 and DNA damage-regulated protein 1 [Denticeps clupeoides]